MARPSTPLLLAFLLAAALAGCVQRSAPITSTTTKAEPRLMVPAEAPPPLPPSGAPAAPLVPVSPFPREYGLSGCLNPRMLFFIDPAVAQASLPPGYKAADATGLLRYVGFPQPPAVATGRAVAGYDFLSCTNSSLDGGAQRFSEVGIFVDAPTFGGKPLGNATNLDLYLLALHTPSPAWRALLASGGFAPDEALDATIAATEADAPGVLQGSGSVAGGAQLAAAAWDGPANGNALTVHARYWHAAAAGTFYLDFQLKETVYAGAIASCTHAAGSSYERVSGTRSCTTEPRFAAIGLGSAIAGGMHWMAGVQPDAAQ